MKLICWLFIALIIGCKNGQQKIERRKIGNYFVESIFINDSVYHGTTKFFSLKGELESKIHFINGTKDGIAINYHKNGNIHDSSFYVNGLKNGDHFVFDSSGELIYQDFYVSGHRLGGHVLYKKQKVYQYIFSNFEKKNIYSCIYDSIGVKQFSGDILNTTIYTTNINNTPCYGLFVYLIYPPNIFVKYTLGIEDTVRKIKKDLQVFSKDRIFIDTVLEIPRKSEQYFVSAEYNDTVNKFHKIYVDKLEW